MMIKILFDELNNREKALLSWLLIFILWLIISKGTRKAVFRLISTFLRGRLSKIFISSVIYTALIIYCLFFLRFWKITLLKESLFWYAGAGFPLFMNFLNEKSKKTISGVLNDSLKWTVWWNSLLIFMFSVTPLSSRFYLVVF